MKIEKYRVTIIGVVTFLLLCISSASAHHSGDHEVRLNTNDKWEECAMVISPDLTQNDWDTFSKDISSILYFRPTGGAKPLGRFNFDIGIELGRTGNFNDYDPAWNNTFSHPDENHWLTKDHYLEIPFLSARMGISDQIDVGLGYTQSYGANYGWLSADLKYAFFNKKSYAVATRVSFSSLFGVQDFDIQQGTIDLLASKSFNLFTPYVGVAYVFTTANETTSKVDLTRINYFTGEVILGLQFKWKYLSLATEIDFARINMYTFKIGTTF